MSSSVDCMDKNILQNIFFCHPQMNESQKGLEWHKGEWFLKIKVLYFIYGSKALTELLYSTKDSL